MNGSIFLNEDELRSKLISLKNQRNRMETIFENVKTDAFDMIEYWSGTNGDAVDQRWIIHVRKDSKILRDFDTKIKFLENVILSYEKTDTKINQRIDDNSNITIF